MSGKGKFKAAAPGRVIARDFESGGTPKTPVKQGQSSNTAISIPSADDDADEDEDDFEEVEIPAGRAGPSSAATTPGTAGSRQQSVAPGTPGTDTTAPSIDDDFDELGEEEEEEEGDKGDGVIRVEFGGENEEEKAKRIALAMRKKPMTSKDRAIRLEGHKLHVVSLLASARIRNRWASNSILKARLLSLLPHPLQAGLVIPPKRFPDRAQRSRMFFQALQDLVIWWSETFFDISDATLGLRTRPWDEVQEIVDKLPKLTKADFIDTSFLNLSDKRKDKGKSREEESEEKMENISVNAGGERLRTVNSLMKKALQQEGSRDVSAILFVSLARACNLGVRLVTSLQPVPWRAEKQVAKKKPTGAGRGGKSLASRQGNGDGTEEEDDEDDMEEVHIPLPEDEDGGPGNVIGKVQKTKTRQAGRRRHIDPADVYRLRAPKPAPKTASTPKKKPSKLNLLEQPPVFWAEVYSRSDQRWIPVDPLKGTIRRKSDYEPTSDNGPVRMTYVVAFEEDGFARDVTLRYTKNFGAKTAKLRPPPRKDEPDWWSEVLCFLRRPQRLHRDELEDAELETSQFSESMPSHMSGFKDHPLYVLERHLKREEVIQPKREIGRFRGEPVYRRASVLSCKTSENWMRIGRRVKDRQEPLKWVKQRAVTIQKRRAQELAMQESGESLQQGLYAQHQTEVYTPPPIQDGKIPMNSFGNIDLYAPTMLPAGAVHLAYKGIAKVAKKLQISYAEACTGFEFKNQRAIPVITGIVVAAENKELVMDAYEESAQAAEERERIKKEEKALKRWIKLMNGLRVRRRLQAEYGQSDNLNEQSYNPLALTEPGAVEGVVTPKVKKSAKDVIANTTKENTERWLKDVSDEDDTPPPREPESTAVEPTQAENQASGQVKDEIQDQVMVAEAREEGVIPPPASVTNGHDEVEADNPSGTATTAVVSDDDMELEEIAPPPRSIKLRFNKPSSDIKPTPEIKTRPARKGKRKPSPSEDEESDEEIVPKKTKTRKARATPAKAKPKASTGPTPTRSLRSRAPKTEEKEQADRAARARIRAALSQDLEDDDEEEMEEV